MKHLNQISKWTTLLFIAGFVTFSSCKKDNTTSQPADTPEVTATIDATQSDAVAEAQFDDVFNITMGVQASDVGEDIGIGAGVGVIYSNTVNPDGTPISYSRFSAFTLFYSNCCSSHCTSISKNSNH